MKSNSFLRNRKALTALLLCTGFVATQPFSVMAEEIVTAVQTVQQQKLLKIRQGNRLLVPVF